MSKPKTSYDHYKGYVLLRHWIFRQKEKYRSDSSIINQIVNAGLPKDHAKSLVATVSELYIIQNQESAFQLNYSWKTWRWLVIALLVAVLCLGGINFYIYHEHRFFYSFAGAAVISLLLLKFVASVRTPTDWQGENDPRKISRHRYSIFSFIPFIILVIVFLLFDQSRLSKAILKDGVLTTGIVRDDYTHYLNRPRMSSRPPKGDNSSLELSVTLLDGSMDLYTVRTTPNEHFMSVSDQMKPIVYLPKVKGEAYLLHLPKDLADHQGPRTRSFEYYLEHREEIEKEAVENAIKRTYDGEYPN